MPNKLHYFHISTKSQKIKFYDTFALRCENRKYDNFKAVFEVQNFVIQLLA